MSRALVVPAIGCALAITGIFAILQRVAAEEDAPRNDAPRSAAETSPVPDDVRATLEALASEYVGPWQKYQRAPASRYSRVIVRPVPSISAVVEFSAADTALPGNLLLATIHVTIIGVSTTSTPCIVDSETKEVRLFAAGRWQKPEDWLKTAPNPRTFRAPDEQGAERSLTSPAAQSTP